jgi:Fur family ferric uptake transcriptional regulator
MSSQVDKNRKEELLGEIISKLREKGLKITSSRTAVVEYLIEYGKHFEIEDLVLWIRERCKSRDDCPSRPTVYRTVKLLEELGYVKSVLKHGNRTIYEFLPLKGEHYHLLCIKCGKLVEFESSTVEEIVKEVCQQNGFKYFHHHLEVYGLCPECQKELEGKD